MAWKTKVKYRQCFSGDVMPARRRLDENSQNGQNGPQNRLVGDAGLDFVYHKW